jgi:hypothetical protein
VVQNNQKWVADLVENEKLSLEKSMLIVGFEPLTVQELTKKIEELFEIGNRYVLFYFS